MKTVEIVIRIPEKYIEGSLFNGIEKIMNAIRAGARLKEGHGRLIDTDALRTKLNTTLREKNISTDAEMLMVLVDLLDNAPVIVEADKEK